MSGLTMYQAGAEPMVPHPQYAQLVGRESWVKLCHARPAECGVCLATIAELLAGEMDHALERAMERPAESYQADLGERYCTLEQAAELRRLVCARCCANGEGLVLADLSAEGWERWVPLEREILRFRLRWLLVAILILMVVA